MNSHSSRGTVVVGAPETPEGDIALTWAALWARARRADLTAVRALGHVGQLGSALRRTSRAAHHQRLRDRLDRLGVPGDSVRTLVEYVPPSTLLRAAARRGDLLVVGSRGVNWLRRATLGSTSARLVDDPTCAVAVIPHDTKPAVPTRIAVAVDDSPEARAALDWALENLDPATQRLIVIHVLVSRLAPRPARCGAPVERQPSPEERAEAIDHAQSLVADAAVRTGVDVEPSYRVIAGDPRVGVRTLAAGIDLLVLGSKGISGWDRLLGSVTDHLVHHPPCPLVVVPAP